jgi:uncharacterized protein (TIGR03663 family)
MKSRRRARARGAGERSAEARPAAESGPPEAPIPATAVVAASDANAQDAIDLLDRWFVPIAIGILLVTAAFRLPELALNPFHHDEGVNGFFTENLVRQGTYRYDPNNYHGPSLYYFALVSEIIFGLTTEAMRLVPVLFGILTVAFVFPLRPYLGSIAVLSAGALLAVSPGAVYVSRYFIHESLVVAFSVALVVSVVLYLDRRSPKYLLAAAAAAAFLFTTKESAVITVLVLLIAVGVANVYLRWRNQAPEATQAGSKRRSRARSAAPDAPGESIWIGGVEYRPAKQRGSGGTATRALDITGEQLAAAAIVFLVIYILLFTSFFSNFPQGIVDSFAAYLVWFQRGDTTQVQPIYQYLVWMFPIDAAILVLGTVGGFIAAIRTPSRLWVIVGLWALGITAALSIPQYKTPWIILNMLPPLALLGGLTIAALWRSARLRLAAPVALGVAVLYSGFFAYDLNFNRYDDPSYPYVFVHSTRDMLSLVAEIEATAERAGTGKETGVVVVSPDYWPLPWYLRDYPRAGFFGQIVETEEAMIVANVNQRAELEPQIQDNYTELRTFNLRPGVDLVLYLRNDIPSP